MSKILPLPSQERLQELFDYSVITGELYWKNPVSYSMKPGDLAGTTNGKYKRVTVDSQSFYLHRIIWQLVTGSCPDDIDVDHIDTDQFNNSWHNLRLADRSQNNYNTRCRANNVSGLKGVCKRKSGYMARITFDGKRRYLGTFPTPEEAHAAYCKAAEELHGEFARTN